MDAKNVQIAEAAIKVAYDGWPSPDSDDLVTSVARALDVEHTHRERQDLADELWEAESMGASSKALAIIAVAGLVPGDDDTWLDRKLEAARVALLLHRLPVGYEFRITDGGTAYTATYRKNDRGLFDQIHAPHAPLVVNMSGDSLGFAVGEFSIKRALTDAVIASARNYA